MVPQSKQNLLKPHRGGTVGYGAGYAAPTELKRTLGVAGTINISLLRSWPAADLGFRRWLGRPMKSAQPRAEERLRLN
jgi:hypothetical protein